MYCRHCFRKRMVGLTEDELNQRVDEAVDYVKRHKEITNILVSGGDAFMNSNAIIERYLRELTAIGHLDFIRFGSRVPVTLPERIWGTRSFWTSSGTTGRRRPSIWSLSSTTPGS